jgi:hypothetical protein
MAQDLSFAIGRISQDERNCDAGQYPAVNYWDHPMPGEILTVKFYSTSKFSDLKLL